MGYSCLGTAGPYIYEIYHGRSLIIAFTAFLSLEGIAIPA